MTSVQIELLVHFLYDLRSTNRFQVSALNTSLHGIFNICIATVDRNQLHTNIAKKRDHAESKRQTPKGPTTLSRNNAKWRITAKFWFIVHFSLQNHGDTQNNIAGGLKANYSLFLLRAL